MIPKTGQEGHGDHEVGECLEPLEPGALALKDREEAGLSPWLGRWGATAGFEASLGFS